MDALVIEGPNKLNGSVQVSGSKNTALPLLFCSILFDKPLSFKNVPRLWDIETALRTLEFMGATCEWDKAAGTVTIVPTIKKKMAPYDWVRKMRAGILALGPLIAKYGEACVSLPGGCAIGARPVNYHIDALKSMGVEIKVEQGYIHARVRKSLKGSNVIFPEVTVTGTENIIIVAACAQGETLIENAACEPEVVSLGELLISAGAQISGLGTPTLRVIGKQILSPPATVRIPPDRIEAGTWLTAAMVTGCPISIENCDASKMGALIEAFRAMGLSLSISREHSSIHAVPPERLSPVDVETHPYPGYATDMQAQVMVAMCLASGRSTLRENIFENRFMHVAELRRLGAKIQVHGNLAIIDGPVEFNGAPVMATDLRASASLVLAALRARGQTKISRIYHLDRGYQQLDQKLHSLGACVKRIHE